MVTLVAECIIRIKKADEKRQRSIYGKVTSIVGIVLNLLLFAAKNVIGVISGSIAITADAFNNLSDACSSIITLMGFWFGSKRADRDHPFGHGRLEYLSGLGVSFLILLMGAELLRDSVLKLIHPEEIKVSSSLFLTLGLSILIKLYMACYNSSIGKKISSGALRASAFDSLSDCVSTTVVLLSVLFFKLTGINIDGWAGVAVSVFILTGGIKMIKETSSPLLGALPDPKLVEKIKALVLEENEILEIHDMIIHDYGPERKMVSLHAEVDGSGDIFRLHDAIDAAENRVQAELGMQTIIHMDPVHMDDEERKECRKRMDDIIRQIDERLSIHDFRMSRQEGRLQFSFDIQVPEKFFMNEYELRQTVTHKAREVWADCELKIQVELSYV